MAPVAHPAPGAPRSLGQGHRRPWRSALLVGLSAALMGSTIGVHAPARGATAPSPGAREAGPALAKPAPTLLAEAGASAVLSASSPDQLALVEILRRKGVVFYGAWWCGHCTHQKSLFGAEAASKLPYVECDKDDPGRLRCQTAKIRAFPTWDYKGERREGVLEIEELKAWVGMLRGAPNRAAKGSQT